MFGASRETDFSVAKGGLDNQVFEVADVVDRLPERVATGGVARENQAVVAAVQLVADCGYHMVGRQGRDAPAVEFHGFAYPDFAIDDERVGLIRNRAEIRPDFPVENMILENFPGFARGMHGDMFLAQSDHGVDQQGQAGDMVEMGVGDENMIDGDHVLDRQIVCAGAGIDEDVAIHQHGCGAQAAAYAAAASQNFDLHCARPRHFVLNVNAPSQSLPGGWARK